MNLHLLHSSVDGAAITQLVGFMGALMCIVTPNGIAALIASMKTPMRHFMTNALLKPLLRVGLRR